MTGCATCSDGTKCTTCKEGNKMSLEGKCSQTCPDGQIDSDNDGKCEACIDNCNKCSAKETCDTCK